MNLLPYLLLCLSLILGNGEIFVQENKKTTDIHQTTIIITYVPDSLAEYRDLQYFLPQIDYLKIPDFPLPSQLPSGARNRISGITVGLRMTTDGQKVVSLDTIETGKRLTKLEKMTMDNIKPLRFRKHEPRTSIVHWTYVLGELIDENYETGALDEILETDTAMMDSCHSVEVVVFPRSRHASNATNQAKDNVGNGSPNNMPQVEYLKLPELGLANAVTSDEITIKVKTDGHSVISVEPIEFRNLMLKNLTVESIMTWRFKEHVPTEFITRWTYDREVDRDIKPCIIKMQLPHKVEIKTFIRPPAPLEVRKRWKKIR
uniref:Uncharacterized protein n=1 Tax=uncultured bacterium contig00001 TaxID=1181493 RepID=A0A806KJR8_9BACT|nr:hypothetical protein [uncultured bacterium contig00001]